MNKDMNTNMEYLESRQMMSHGIASVTSDDAIVTPGQVVTVSIEVNGADAGNVSAATLFRDMNSNGRWDAGIDVDLGSTSNRNGNTFVKQLTIGAGWSGTARIMADAVTSGGAWASTREGVTLRINQMPTLTEFGITPRAANTPASVFAKATDDSGVRGMTFFLDRNENGKWDSGTDTSLGTVFSRGSDDRFRVSFTPDDSWARSPRIVADAVDDDNDWSRDRRGGQHAFDDSWSPSAPSLSNLTVSQDWARTDGKRITIRVSALDNSAVRAVTFFIDHDDNGRWTPGVDDSLGTSGSSSGGVFSLTTLTDFAGRPDVRIVADAVDFDGSWASARLSGTARNGWGFVSELEAEQDSGTQVELEAKYTFPRIFGRTAPTSASWFIFRDTARDGVYDSANDPVIASGTDPVDVDGNIRARPRPTLGALWASNNRYGTALVSSLSGNLSANIISNIRYADQRSSNPNLPRITDLDDQVGSSSEYARVGSTYVLTGTFEAPHGASVVSFFFDKNLNGIWDSGTDIDLGSRSVSGTVGSFTFTGTVQRSMIGFGAFAAVVKDVTSGSESWSQPVSEEVTQIFAAPTVRNVSGGAFTAPRGTTLTFDVNYSDDSSARAATAFIDANGNGLFDGPDSGYVATTTLISAGSRSEGTMRLSINTTGLGAGTYTIYFAVSDHHRGDDSSPGGRSNGMWSSRYAIQITLT
jgi:hypothetical protein